MIGAVLKSLRHDQEDLSISQLSQIIGLSESCISSIESGQRDITPIELEKFAKFYKTTPASLRISARTRSLEIAKSVALYFKNIHQPAYENDIVPTKRNI